MPDAVSRHPLAEGLLAEGSELQAVHSVELIN